MRPLAGGDGEAEALDEEQPLARGESLELSEAVEEKPDTLPRRSGWAEAEDEAEAGKEDEGQSIEKAEACEKSSIESGGGAAKCRGKKAARSLMLKQGQGRHQLKRERQQS